jgi:ABC-type lipoprotein export system ATPase subunit
VTPFAGVVRGRGLTKTYRRDAEDVHALREVNLELYGGELVALVGPSGSGKSTLLNVLCGWEQPDHGSLQWTEGVAGRSAADLAWAELALVPQALGLLDDLTLAENILLPARQASLGEQQRCCAARALLLRPALLLADEPTAHQDAAWTDVLFTEFRDLLRAGSTCLIATHNPQTWGYADRILSMQDGELRAGAPEPVH